MILINFLLLDWDWEDYDIMRIGDSEFFFVVGHDIRRT